jgi:long-chain acyl-CoA synthetase
LPAHSSDPVTLADRAPKPWLRHYPPGVPATIDETSLGTLADIFDESVRRYPERPAAESFGHRLTYAELAAAAGAVASWLQTQNIGKGDRVAIMLPNVMAYPAILFGILTAGATVVNVNPLYTPRELTHQLNDSGARILFVLENFAHTVEHAREVQLDTVVVVKPGDLLGLKGTIVNLVSRYVKRAVPSYALPRAAAFADVLKAGRARPPARVAIALEDVAFLQYTGGTTGIAKGATLTHRNVAANIAQCDAWLTPSFGDKQLIMVTALPLYHIFALTACALVYVRLGGCLLLVANPRDIPGFVKLLKTRPFTCISGVNTLYNALTRAPGIEQVDFSKLMFCVAGGMATQATVAAAWKRLTGRPIIEGYGLSETSPVVTTNRPDIPEFTGSIGYPMPSTDVSIRSIEDGTPVLPGEAGELCVRGPQVMKGYWHRPDETARVMTADGFFRTGDIAVMQEDGSLRIVDRLKDMILVSGFNVYPNEVEDVMAGHPGVAEVAVVGAAGPDGEIVTAHVVRADPGLTDAALNAWCRERLTPYKVPRRIVFCEALPKTNVGKVLRRALRDGETAGSAPPP